MKKWNLTSKIMLAAAGGIMVGAFFGRELQWLQVIGDIFLRLIQMSIVLLVLGNVVEAVGNLNPGELGKIGVRTFAVFIISSVTAAAWGVGAGSLFRPGGGMDTSLLAGSRTVETEALQSVPQIILSFIPTSIIRSMADNTVIHVILFGLLFGIAAGSVAFRQGDRRLLDLVSVFNQTMLRLIVMIMNMAPFAICSIMITTIGRLGIQVIIPLAKYLAVYGFATLAFWILWQLFVCAACKVKLIRLIKNMANISLMALTTISSAVTLPTTLKDSRERCGIGSRTANLVLPLGMSLNCNGAAMHMAITVITISQMYGITYDIGHLVYIVALSTFASMANTVAPGASMVSLSIVVPAMGLPLESIALFAGADWFVGMLRTILNVDADVFTAMLVGLWEEDIDFEVFHKK